MENLLFTSLVTTESSIIALDKCKTTEKFMWSSWSTLLTFNNLPSVEEWQGLHLREKKYTVKSVYTCTLFLSSQDGGSGLVTLTQQV